MIKQDAPKLTDNFHFSMARINAMKNSLAKHPERERLYNESLKQKLENSKIAQVMENIKDAKIMEKEYFYLPHQ